MEKSPAKTQPPEEFEEKAQLPSNTQTNLTPETDEIYSKCDGVDIRELTILEIQDLFSSKQLTSEALTKCYLQRIHQMDPTLKSVVEINPDAINQAQKADSERNTSNKSLGPMHGIPILLKDNIATNDHMETTAGSLALVGIRPKKDADIVTLLRKAGAVIIGKATLSEFANFRGNNVPGGWCSRSGQGKNPYNLKVNPQGSSSGSAIAVAANLVTVSIGSETDGSLIAPASINGVCTIKPTHGVISTRGVIPLSHTQDTLGPMARTVTDLAIVLDAIIPDKQESTLDGSYTSLLRESPTKKYSVGVVRYPLWKVFKNKSTSLEFESPQLENILKTIKASEKLKIIDPVQIKPDLLKKVNTSKETTVFLHDFKHGINEYLTKSVYSPSPPAEKITTLADIIQFNKEHPSTEEYNQELLIQAEATDGLNNKTYLEARDGNRAAARELLDALFNEYQLDVVMALSNPDVDSSKDPVFQESPVAAYSLAAIAGYPSLNIPVGIGVEGVPFGVTFIGPPMSEGKLLQIAFAVEQMLPKRSTPQFLTEIGG